MQVDAALEGMDAQNGRHAAVADLDLEDATVQRRHRPPSVPGLHGPPPKVSGYRPTHGDDGLWRDPRQQALQVSIDALVEGRVGDPVRVLGRAANRPGVKGRVHDVVLFELLAHPLAGGEHDRTDELKVGEGRLRGHVVLEPSLVLEPFGEGLVAGACRVERARADEDDRCLGVAESHLGPAEWLCESFARAVGAPVGLGDRAPVQALEGVRAEELQVLLALAHAVGNDAGRWAKLAPLRWARGSQLRFTPWQRFRPSTSRSCGVDWTPRGRSPTCLMSGSPGSTWRGMCPGRS